MTRMPTTGARRSERGRVFTIELNSGSDVKRLNVPNGTQRVLMEGTIGSLKHAGFVEDAVLELEGSEGVLRVDLSMDDLAKRTPQKEEGPIEQ